LCKKRLGVNLPVHNYLSKSTKSKPIQKVLNEALHILESVGIPFEGLTERRLEKMAMSFLAVLRVKRSKDWKNAKQNGDGWAPQTRQIIDYINLTFSESISSGSYDDIRRKDLKLLTVAGIVERAAKDPNAAMNDPTRGYSLNPIYTDIVRSYGSKGWDTRAKRLLKKSGSLKTKLANIRDIQRVSVKISDRRTLRFSPGKHNDLQKTIIEEFLPRYGFGAEVLYVGDTAKKYLLLEEGKLAELKFFEIKHGELPDVVAYSEEKNWLYLVEAVHSSGPISPIRLVELKRLTTKCTADIVYITAFLDRATFRQWAPDIAWETEVWIAEAPDHLIHFNGDKFLGPYKE
jgi:BsuBI/PstI restriction endonuclease domain/BsuBI/PstI restriction endonuclease HTH domain